MTAIDSGMIFLIHKIFRTDERKRLVSKGQAMPGGGFPIRNEADLKNAIQAYGRASNKPAAMAWIKKRAKALGLERLLPDSWKEATEHRNAGEAFLEHFGVKGMRWGVRRSRKQLRKEAEASGAKAVKKMSDDDLRQLVNRLNMEQQYSRLTASPPGRSRVKAILATGATVNSAIAFARSPAGQGIKNAIARATDTSAAVGSIGKFR